MTAIDIVKSLVDGGLAPKERIEGGPLTVVPLFGGAPAKEYVLGQQAFADGTLKVGELDGGTVPELEAFNRGTLPVLLLDGEHLKGARQDRILNASILLPAQKRTVLPVSCVEQGRWHYEDATSFTPAQEISYSRLRRTNAQHRTVSALNGEGREVNQSAVWADVAQKHHEVGVEASDTGAMQDAFATHASELDHIVKTIGDGRPGQTGAVAIVGGRVTALDAFDRPETFAAIWPRLVRGYAMDALGVEPGPSDEDTLARFLDSVHGSIMVEAAGVGLGIDVVMTSERIVGNALTWAEGIVHLAVFPKDDIVHAPDAGDIQRPSQRRLRRLAE